MPLISFWCGSFRHFWCAGGRAENPWICFGVLVIAIITSLGGGNTTGRILEIIRSSWIRNERLHSGGSKLAAGGHHHILRVLEKLSEIDRCAIQNIRAPLRVCALARGRLSQAWRFFYL